MQPTVYRVGDKARLLAIRTDRFKSELLSVQFAIPIAAATAQEHALFFELLRRGTERYPTKALFHRHLDDLYASSIAPHNRRVGDMQVLCLTADFLGARFVGGGEGLLPRIVELMAELLYHPYFPEGHFHTPYVESEKQNLRDAIRSRINAPRALARSKCRALLCEGEPYALSLIGEEDTVDAITAEGLTASYRRLLLEITPTFFYVGNSDPAALAELLAEHFETAAGAPPVYRTKGLLPDAPVRRRDEQMPLCQGKLSIGYRTDVTLTHPLSAAMVMLNEIFGGSAASKLFLNVRERRSLCYHCSSTLDLYKGVMFAGSGMRVENRDVTEAAMRAELEAIVRGEISDEEMIAARHSLGNAYRQMYDNPAALFGFYMGRALIGNEETVEQRRDALMQIGREDVVQAASHVREGAVFFLEGTLGDGEVEE